LVLSGPSTSGCNGSIPLPLAFFWRPSSIVSCSDGGVHPLRSLAVIRSFRYEDPLPACDEAVPFLSITDPPDTPFFLSLLPIPFFQFSLALQKLIERRAQISPLPPSHNASFPRGHLVFLFLVFSLDQPGLAPSVLEVYRKVAIYSFLIQLINSNLFRQLPTGGPLYLLLPS